MILTNFEINPKNHNYIFMQIKSGLTLTSLERGRGEGPFQFPPFFRGKRPTPLNLPTLRGKVQGGHMMIL